LRLIFFSVVLLVGSACRVDDGDFDTGTLDTASFGIPDDTGTDTGTDDTGTDVPLDTIDADGDGYSPAEGDCDDSKSALNPAATDQVGDGIDQNCDGADGFDGDGDGSASPASGGDDCDDAEPASYPSNTEACFDGIDNDCDLSTKDDDCDQDGAGADVDCDDNDPTVPTTEIPYNGIDENCSGSDLTDVDGDGFDGDTGPDCDDDNEDVYPGAWDGCNGVDDDCDGVVDGGTNPDPVSQAPGVSSMTAVDDPVNDVWVVTIESYDVNFDQSSVELWWYTGWQSAGGTDVPITANATYALPADTVSMDVCAIVIEIPYDCAEDVAGTVITLHDLRDADGNVYSGPKWANVTRPEGC